MRKPDPYGTREDRQRAGLWPHNLAAAEHRDIDPLLVWREVVLGSLKQAQQQDNLTTETSQESGGQSDGQTTGRLLGHGGKHRSTEPDRRGV